MTFRSSCDNASRTYRGTTASSRSNYRYNRYNHFRHPHNQGNLLQFFIKARATVVELDKELLLIDYKQEGQTNQVKAFLWRLKVTNRHRKLSISLKDCKAFLFVNEFGRELSMIWDSGIYERRQITEAYYNELKPKQTCLTIGHQAQWGLASQSRSIADIPAGYSKLLYFMLTIEGCDKVFPILQLDDPVHTHNESDDEDYVYYCDKRPLILEYGKQYKPIIRFDYENTGKEFGLTLSSYDQIELDGVRTRSRS